MTPILQVPREPRGGPGAAARRGRPRRAWLSLTEICVICVICESTNRRHLPWSTHASPDDSLHHRHSRRHRRHPVRAGQGRRRHAHRARRGVPAGHHRNTARQLPGARVPGAQHPRLPAEVDPGHRRAQGAEGEVPGGRHPRPRVRPRQSRHHGQDGEGARRAQPAPVRERRQLIGRPPHQHAGGHQGQPLQGSFPRARWRRLPQRGAGVGRQGREAARGRHQGRRPRRGRGRQGVRPADSQGRWQPPARGRSRARPAVGGLRAARRARVHPHGGAAGVLPAARHDRTSAGSSWRSSAIAATTSPGR